MEMHGLIRVMIHAVKKSENGILPQEEIFEYSQGYDGIVVKTEKE